MVKGRLDEDAKSIDDVISLLTYIDSLKKQDNKMEEIADFIDVMQNYFEYIYSLRVLFKDEIVMEFLHIRNWPRSFEQWIKNRKL